VTTRLITVSVVNPRLPDHLLDVDPIQLVLGKVFSFFFLGLSVFKEKHADKEIDQEKGTDQNENHEVVAIVDVAFENWTLVNSSCIHRLVHNLRPAFEGSNDKQ
jgi:hypothetical protein